MLAILIAITVAALTLRSIHRIGPSYGSSKKIYRPIINYSVPKKIHISNIYEYCTVVYHCTDVNYYIVVYYW